MYGQIMLRDSLTERPNFCSFRDSKPKPWRPMMYIPTAIDPYVLIHVDGRRDSCSKLAPSSKRAVPEHKKPARSIAYHLNIAEMLHTILIADVLYALALTCCMEAPHASCTIMIAGGPRYADGWVWRHPGYEEGMTAVVSRGMQQCSVQSNTSAVFITKAITIGALRTMWWQLPPICMELE